MPFGISESTLRRAYAPLDLSGIYNRVDAFQRTLIAENKAKKQEALKQYYTELASLNKERVGVRAADAADVSRLYSEWSKSEKELANNPRLINRNPEQYGKLKNTSDEKYSQLLTLIKGSKELDKEDKEAAKILLDPSKQDMYVDNAYSIWKNNVSNNSYLDVIKNGHNDITRLYEPTINGAKFRADMASDILSKGFRKHEGSFIGPDGQTYIRTFEKAPDIAAIQGAITKSLYGNFGEKKADKYAAQELKDMTQKDLENIATVYDNYRNNVSKKIYGSDAPAPPDLFSNWNEQSNAQRLINIKTAEALSNVDTSYKQSVGQLGAREKALLSASLREQIDLRKEAREGAKSPMIDIHSSMLQKFPTQTAQEKALMFPGTKFIPEKELKEFTAAEQSAVVSYLKDIGFEKPSASDFKLQRADNNDLIVIPNVDFKIGKDVRYPKGKPATRIPGKELNIKASGVLGVGGKKSAAAGGSEANDFGL